ncbi:MAG: SLBB domain-containing protein [Pyrinomonadaceae bacterium]
MIDIHVKGFVEYDWRGSLNPEGFIDSFEKLPNVVRGQCRTVDAIAFDVTKELSTILREPKVEVRIIDRSKRALAIIDGAVKTPLRMQMRRNARLNEIIINAGGMTDRTSGEILISRPAGLSCLDLGSSGNDARLFKIRIPELLSGDEKANPVIVSGDLIVVTEASPVYLLGAVATQGKIDFRPELTVRRAIDSSGGILKDAIQNKINIFRRDGGTSVIAVDLAKILANQADDVRLRPFDIIDVPYKGRPARRLPPVIEDENSDTERRLRLPVKIIE